MGLGTKTSEEGASCYEPTAQVVEWGTSRALQPIGEAPAKVGAPTQDRRALPRQARTDGRSSVGAGAGSAPERRSRNIQ